MKKVKTLIGAIMAIVPTVIFTAIYGFITLLLLDMIFSLDGDATAGGIILLLAPMILAVVVIVLNACMIALAIKGDEKYRKKKGLVIVSIVFNILFAAFLVYMIAVAESFSLALVGYIAIALVMLVVCILYIIDLKSRKLAVKEENDNLPIVHE